MPKVLNTYKVGRDVPNSVYIGRRKKGMHFGNPFKIGVDGTREEVIEKHLMWAIGAEYQDIEPKRLNWIAKNLYTLIGKDLLCYCAPLPCHGDNYLKMLELGMAKLPLDKP